jgi:hypothetical protein
MLDDGPGVIIAGAPLAADGTPAVLVAGEVPTFSVDNTALGTLDPSIDPTGLSCKFVGIKGMAGVATVTMSLTNADGTVATGSAVITITLDPAEVDVASFAMSVTPASS